MRNLVMTLGLIICLLFSTAPALAARTASVPVRIVLVPGSLPISLSGSDIMFPAVRIKTTNSYVTTTSSNELFVNDPSGQGQGWHVTVRGTDLIRSDGLKMLKLSDVNFTINKITSSDISSDSDISGITGTSSNLSVNYTDQTILSAASGKGMGGYFVSPRYTMKVLKTAPSGDYSNSLTYTVFVGP